MREKPMSLSQLEEIYQMRQTGLDFSEIANKFRLKTTVVTYHFNNYQLTRDRQLRDAKAEIEERRQKLFNAPPLMIGDVFVHKGEMYLNDKPNSKVEWSPIANKYITNLLNH